MILMVEERRGVKNDYTIMAHVADCYVVVGENCNTPGTTEAVHLRPINVVSIGVRTCSTSIAIICVGLPLVRAQRTPSSSRKESDKPCCDRKVAATLFREAIIWFSLPHGDHVRQRRGRINLHERD